MLVSCPGQQFNDFMRERYQYFDYFTAWQGACLCPVQGNNSMISGQNDNSLSITLLRGKEHPCVLPRATIQLSQGRTIPVFRLLYRVVRSLFVSCPGQKFNDLRAERYQSFDYFIA
ncbi:hypothetical protein TNCV_1664291 [Trichonephila clavipes]|uniref:Uncharacterized protein n=1 Tax=Trichonephila clavipes TaxID=2585209 RepID=A0A8X6RWW0_TRICX|nr:hypothetical protein TNCV_1664291 [Trichonephila clavipes]